MGKEKLVANSGQDGNEVGFESLHCPFSLVLPVLSRGNKSVPNDAVLDALLHCCQALVVEYLFFDTQSCCLHLVYQLLVRSHHFALCPVLHRLGKDVVRVEVDNHHDVSVAALGCVGESSCLVGVNLFGEVFHPDKDIVQF